MKNKFQNYNPTSTDKQKELLCEVDEKDNLIGPVTRLECHNETRKPWHRSSHLYLFSSDGRLYLSKRSSKKDTAKGLWTVSAGGHVKYKDSYEETIQNEISEELGLSNIEVELLYKLHIDYGSEREVIAIFAGVADKPLKYNAEEVEEIRLFEYKEIVQDFLAGKFDLSGGSRDTFKHIIQAGSLDKFYNEHFPKILLK